ncbi:MAG: glutamine-hydrolyzing carbamoyl-phosphate synthase small subunit [Nitrososphaerota archaeon]|nr:glutamine-hydrolyzing carbamoyl-phosphate synthase small subunit [Nitrososphaerota archaeon]MDG6941802.1 glutamine-hydrolyzing carbamoyl-phosphate synthase small subunit [Nitrososphaerota archaeon]MDG6947025.1 glutamine-hydrolyzing carbamoyl-phosphate synthase small subunit [Nitrososphaerota archaeon]MDG6950563.1 glutamine-hydrolyzing carbamoyl-phosphate synthase small subunit [Nitrososphaerota archaeon]
MLAAKRDALLLLEDGSTFFGQGFGAEADSVGEVVFNTGMVGYLESMTDPSYAGQILTFTYPLIGNYGVPPYSARDKFDLPRFFESDSIKVRGIVVQEACDSPSHWASERPLWKWMESEGIPGIQGVDTRALVSKLREAGVMMGIIACGHDAKDRGKLAELLAKASSYSSQNLVKGVSVPGPVVHGGEGPKIVVLDCGTKLGIVRNLLRRGFQVVRLPYDSSYSAVMQHDPAGVVVCNGPGDPQLLADTAKCVGSLIDGEVPVLGICLGEQLVGMSQGAETFKLKYGHRGQNKPCVDLATGRGYVTSQNHGYAISETTLKGTDLRQWFANADDNTIEGVLHASRPCMAVQFHPEATPGPYDTLFVFDRFIEMTRKARPLRGEEIRSVKA